jgi:hypothetical protein
LGGCQDRDLLLGKSRSQPTAKTLLGGPWRGVAATARRGLPDLLAACHLWPRVIGGRRAPTFRDPQFTLRPHPIPLRFGRHERLQVSESQARVAELEDELAGARTTKVSDDRVVVGQPGLEDSRNAYADTLLRLPRSERLKEVGANVVLIATGTGLVSVSTKTIVRGAKVVASV